MHIILKYMWMNTTGHNYELVIEININILQEVHFVLIMNQLHKEIK